MSSGKTEIERVHEVLSLMLKNLECPICLDLMKDPVSTKCDHQFCRFCILKLFKKRNNSTQCPLCNNNITKRSLRESTRFKQLTEGLMKTIHAFELDTGFEFSISNTFTKETENISTYQQLWLEDSNSQSTSTPPKVVASGGDNNRTLKIISTDPPVTESVRSLSPRTKRQKVDAAVVSIEIDSDSSDEPLFTANVNAGSAPRPKRVDNQTGKVDPPQDERLMDGNNSKLADENHVVAELDGDSHSSESQTKEEPKTKDPSEWSFCSPEVDSPPKVSPQNLTGHDGGAVTEKGRQVGVATCSVDSGEEFLDKSALKRGQGEECVPEDLNTPDLGLPAKGFVRSEESPSDAQPSARRKGQRSIEKVSEWLSTIDAAKVGGELKPRGQSGELDAAAEGGESQVTDENSRSGRSQAITRRSLPSPVGDKNLSKATRARAEDQVFGKTYTRGARRGSPRVSRSWESDGKGRGDGAPICTQGNRDGIDRDEPRRGKKRKSACPRLGPEDFVRKKESGRDKERGGGGRESETDGPPNTQDFAVGPLVGEGAREVLAEDERGSAEKEPCSVKSKTDPNNNSTGGGKRRRKVQKMQTPRKQARKGAKRLQLVGQNEMERMELPPAGSPGDENETRIDSFPSSEEPARAERDAGGARRRSGRLKLLDQELILRGDSRKRSGRSGLTGKPGSHLKSAGVAETRSPRLQEVLAPKSPDTNVNPTPPGEFSSAQRRLNPTDPFKPSEDRQRGCDLPSAGSDRSSPANSGSRASPWLLVDRGEPRDTPRARSESAVGLEPMSPGRVCGQPAVTPGSGGGDRGSAERTPAASQHEAAAETEDSEVDTEALLKTFRSTKRKSFVLQPVDQRSPPASQPQPQPQPSGDEPAVELKETSDGLDASRERAENVNENHAEDENERERALVTSEAEVPTFEPNRTSPRRPRAEVDSLEFIPPTFGSPPTPSSLQRRSRPPSRSPAANTRSSQRRGSGERAVAGVAEIETLLSDRSSQCGSVIPATPKGERGRGARRAPPALEKTATGTELSGNSDQESTLLFSAKSQPVRRGAAMGGTRPKSSRSSGETPDPGVERPRSQHEAGAKDGGLTEDGLDDGSGRTKAASRANGTEASRAPTPLASPGCSSTPEGLVEESVSEEGGSLPGEAGGGGGGGGVPAVSRARSVEVLIHREEEEKEEEETAEPSDWGLEDSGGAELVVGRRKRPVKLSSSSSESSDEELPCFQMLGFVNQSSSSDSKSMSTQSPLITALAPSKDAPGEIISPNGATAMENARSQVNAALEKLSSSRNKCLPASQSSEESPDLFSSDSEGGSCSPPPSGPRAEQAGGKPAGGTAGRCPAGKARGNGSRRSSQEAHAERAWQRREATDRQPTGKPGLGVSERSGGGQGPGYDSEASHTGDSFSSDSELLTTQRDAIQTDLKKLKEEMAVLEAALGQDTEQQASQHTVHGLSQSPQDNSPAPTEEESAVATVTRAAGARQTPSEAATNLIITKSKHATATIGPETESQPDTSLIFVDRHRAQNECPESPERAASPPPTELPTDGTAAGERTEESGALDAPQPETTSCRGEGERARVPRTPQQRADRESAVPADQASPGMVSGQPRPDSEGKDCVSEETGPVPGCRPQAPDGVGRPEASSLRPPVCSGLLEGLEQTRSLLTSSPIFNKSADSATGERPAMTTGRRMSFVASGLSKHEILLVQGFAEKTGGSISSQFLPSTTHVVMKTDTSLVCERTLKYFLGIAGRRWVISYQWILECLKEGRIIEEDEFEVRGDVINGRDHQGPRKARLTTNGQLLFTDYEVCCWGSFTGMSKDQLEWLVDLCGASIVKEPYLFNYNPDRVSVVVVQPDANPASTDYRAMERRFSAAVVTREWVLDSVACYRCRQLGAYLLGTPR